MRRFQDDAAKAQAEVEKLGGKVERDEFAEGKPIVAVNFATARVKDADLACLKGLGAFPKLTLNNNKDLTDAALDHVKDLAGLKKLYLVDTKLTDAGLDKLKDMKDLEVLSLVGTEVTDAGLDKLKEIANLKEVFLHGTKVTDEGAKKFQEGKPNVKVAR